jgi:hypothetical protein
MGIKVRGAYSFPDFYKTCHRFLILSVSFLVHINDASCSAVDQISIDFSGKYIILGKDSKKLELFNVDE